MPANAARPDREPVSRRSFLASISLRALDFAAIAVSAGVAGFFTWRVVRGGGGRRVVEVTAPSGEWLYSLEEDRILRVAGPIGDTVVAVGPQGVRVVSSPCQNQICVKTGTISSANQWIACLPNRVFVSVSGDRGQVDAYSF